MVRFLCSAIFLFLDFDECAAKFDNCDPNAYCNNTVGSFNCTCNSGYTGNGTTCTGKYDLFFLDNGLKNLLLRKFFKKTVSRVGKSLQQIETSKLVHNVFFLVHKIH